MARATENGSADFLRGLRTRQGLSRQDVAERAGFTVQTIARYERDGIKGSARFGTVRRVCKAYGITADHLLSVVVRHEEWAAPRA